jgi:hypothetical protein
MTCPHQSQPPGKDTGRRLCALGYANGRPFVGACNICIAKGQNIRGLGDRLEKAFHPIATAINWPCLDNQTGSLKPTSPCAKMRDRLNKLAPTKPL